MIMMAICTSVTSTLWRSCGVDIYIGPEQQLRYYYKKDWVCDLQAKAQGPGHVGLPVGTEEHEHPNETTEEDRVWV